MEYDMRKGILYFVAIFFCGCANAAYSTAPQIIPRYDVSAFDSTIQHIYSNVLNSKDAQTLNGKVTAIGNYFLGEPYLLGALGEGPTGEFDKNPLYRTDAFDCMTFVSTMLALVEAHNLAEFRLAMLNINYHGDNATFFTRNHFTNLDWNLKNQHNGYLVDVTRKIGEVSGVRLAKLRTVMIDRPRWFASLSANTLKSFTLLSTQVVAQQLSSLHNLANKTTPKISNIYYLPLTSFSVSNTKPVEALFAEIPTPSVIEFVGGNKNVIGTIGTDLDVWHMGLVVKTARGLMLYEASSSPKYGIGIIALPLQVYLRGLLHSPTIQGINIQKIESSLTG